MQKVIAPKLDLQTTEIEILRWRKHEGDLVAQGEVILEISTEKATVDIEAPEGGRLQGIACREGERVKVGETLAYILGENERLPEAASATPGAGPEVQRASAETPRPAAATPRGKEVRSTPAARQLCRQNSLTVEEVYQATGKEPVSEKEVQSYLAARTGKRQEDGEFEEAPLSYRRTIIARRMQESARTIPHIHLFSELSLDALERRKAALAAGGLEAGLTALLLCALGRVLGEFPAFNATYAEQGSAGLLRKHRRVNIGLAVATEHGLVVPVLKDVTGKKLNGIVQEKAELLARARGNRLSPVDLAEATFTLSNLGEYQVSQFTAIINPPQVAILSMGKAMERLVLAADGKPRTGRTVGVCLGLDHRALDGADGGRFLSRLKELIEAPPEELFS